MCELGRGGIYTHALFFRWKSIQHILLRCVSAVLVDLTPSNLELFEDKADNLRVLTNQF